MQSMDFMKSMHLLKKAGIPFIHSKQVRGVRELRVAMRTMSSPFALKAISKEFTHKQDMHAVRLHLSFDNAIQAFKELQELPGFDYAVVQEMVEGTELILGGKRDAQFGATVLFGLGGTFVEIFKDVSLRVCPISKKDALEMLSEVKASKLLDGFRGNSSIDRHALADLLVSLSHVMLADENIQEIDINPLIASKKGLHAVDVRIIKD